MSSPTRVQFKAAATAGSGIASVSTGNLDSSVTAGNLILVFVRSGFVGGVANEPPTMSGLLGTVFSSVESAETQDPSLFCFKGIAAGSGTENITATFTGSDGNYCWILAVEITGQHATLPINTSGKKAAGAATDCLSAPITTDVAGCYVLMAVGQNNLDVYTAGTDFALLSGNIGGFGGVQDYTPAGILSGYVGHITSNGSDQYTTIIVAVAPANSVTPPTAGFSTSVDLKTVTITSTAVAGTNPITSITYDYDHGGANSAPGDASTTHTYPSGQYGAHTIRQTVVASDATVTVDHSISTKTRRIVTIQTVNGRGVSGTIDTTDT